MKAQSQSGAIRGLSCTVVSTRGMQVYYERLYHKIEKAQEKQSFSTVIQKKKEPLRTAERKVIMAKKSSVDNEDFNSSPVITLDLEEGGQMECYLVATFPAGEYDYAALLPCEGEKYEEGEVFLYRFREEDGEPVLDQIETDEEFDIVSDAFDELLDSMEYDEIVSEEEAIEEE